MAMTFGIHALPQDTTIDELRRLWQWADSVGFEWISTSDHFEEGPPRDRNGHVFEAISILSAIACHTRHARIGCHVFCIGYRNPGVLAKSLMTIDHLSGGRVECPIGAGWHELEHQAFGFPFPRAGVREDQMEEYAQCLRMLFDQPISNFHGKHFTLDEARCYPKPLQSRIPIVIGGSGEKRTLPAVARYADGWNAYLSPEDFIRKNRLLDELCAQHRRDPKAVHRTVNVMCETLFSRPRQEIVDVVGRYRDAGVQRLSIAVRGPFDWDAMQAYAEQVMPVFGVKPSADGQIVEPAAGGPRNR